MSEIMFVEGDYILTIDPTKVTRVVVLEESYLFVFKGGISEVVSKKYTNTIAKLLELVKQNFDEVFDFSETDKPAIDYKFLLGCASAKFNLAFADFQSYDKAWEMLEKEFTKQHNARNWGISHYSDLVFSVSFPLYYDDYLANKKTITDILGEPVNA